MIEHILLFKRFNCSKSIENNGFGNNQFRNILYSREGSVENINGFEHYDINYYSQRRILSNAVSNF